MDKNAHTDTLELEEIVGVIGGSVRDLKNFVNERSLDDKELERLLKAEKSAKNRKTAVNFIKDLLEHDDSHQEYHESTIGLLKAVQNPEEEPRIVVDIDGIKFDLDEPTLNFAGHSFEISHSNQGVIENSSFSNLQPKQPVETVQSPDKGSNGINGGSSQIQDENLQQLKEHQRELQQEIQEEIENKREEKEKEKLISELEREFPDKNLREKSLLELQELEDIKKKREKKRRDLSERFDVDEKKLKQKNLEELEELEQKLEKLEDKRTDILQKHDVDSSDIEDKSLEELKNLEKRLDERQARRDELKRRYNVADRELEGKNLEELEELGKRLKRRKKLANKLSKYGYNSRKLQKKSIEDLEELIDEIKQKKELLDDISVQIDDKELKEMSLKEIKAIKEEKEERNKLIDKLEDEGLDPEDLETCSNRDLENLLEDIENKAEDESEDLEEEVVSNDVEPTPQPSKKELEEEAEEDLKLLMGAIHKEEEEEEEHKETTREKISDLTHQLKDPWSRFKSGKDNGEDEEDKKREKTLELLENYRTINNTRTSVIKTAQIMKGYIEHRLEIDHELTYSEVADTLRDLDREDEDIQTAVKFFEIVNKNTYAGTMNISNPERFIDTSENLIEKLG